MPLSQALYLRGLGTEVVFLVARTESVIQQPEPGVQEEKQNCESGLHIGKTA